MSLIDKLLHGKEGESLMEALKEAHHPRGSADSGNEEEQAAEVAEASEENTEEAPDTEYEVVEREILPAKIICPDCGGITLEGLEFCDKCGGELQ